MKKCIGIALIVLGAVLFLLGSHEAIQAAEDLIYAESSGSYRRPTLGPVRRGVRTQENQSTQEHMRIAGDQALSEKMSGNLLRGIGIVFVIAGVGYIIFLRKRRT